MANDALIRGDGYAFAITLTNADATPFNMAGSSVFFAAVPTTTGADDTTAFFEQAIVFATGGAVTKSEQYDAAGVVDATITNPLALPAGKVAADGLLTQTITAATTNAIATGSTVPVNYKWELQVVDVAGVPHTVLSGTGTVTPDIIRRTVAP